MDQINKPVFVYYLNLEGCTRAKAEEQMQLFCDHHFCNDYHQIFLASNVTKVECIYKGFEAEKNQSILEHLKTLLEDESQLELAVKHINLVFRAFKIKKILTKD